MALLPSGLNREEVELVVIETDDLTLYLKGKPYHERYETLMQYHKRSYFQDEKMELDVTAENLQYVHVFDVQQGELIEKDEHAPIFFENVVYQLVAFSKNGKSLRFHHEHPGLRRAVSTVKAGRDPILMGNLQFKNEVGYSTFEIHEGDKKLVEVTIEVFPSKLNYKEDYTKLLREVNEEVYNLAYHFVKKTYVGAVTKVEEKPTLAEFYRLIQTHFQDFLHALKRIETQPHHELKTIHEHVRGDRLRRVVSKGRSYLRKRPYLLQEVPNGIEMAGKSYMPTKGLGAKKVLSYDTHENRFVKWMMNRLVNKLDELRKKVADPGWRNVEIDEDLLGQVDAMKRELERKLRSLFWREIGELDRSVMSLVMQMAPGYRDSYKIFLILSRGLALEGKFYQMSVKDVALLYEYWTFLKLGQILSKKYIPVKQDIIKVNREGLFVNLVKDKSASREFKHPLTNEKIILEFQMKDGKLPTVTQMPDTVLKIEKKGKDHKYHYIFDAKYRVDFAVNGSYYERNYKSPGPLEDDINTMHRYRDALVVQEEGPYERYAFGAYVLFPWFDEEMYEKHDFYKSINKVNIGGFPFLPQSTRLVEQFIEHLIEKSPEEIQREGILPQGSLKEWESSINEKVLVGMVPRELNYNAHLQHRFYHIPVKQLKKGWQEAKYIALYPKKGAAKENGVTCYGEIVSVSFVKRPEIKELPKASSEEYVRFEVDAWNMLEKTIRPVGYGISVYTLTTLNTLENAKELPELFMKTKEEVTLWRMLRRFSNKVTTELDSTHLDRASGITEYRMKDVRLRIDRGNELLVMDNHKGKKSIDIKWLTQNPTYVFKEVTKLLGTE
ncbi:DUF2357 domain-containing protein [Guptibacillus hwajinpoensis]|uniref:DUF2357 domain-containing protein n=1 Tax=Guptibacillus hwajinpoensis TaxID=208199 RepID=UPI003735A7FC